MVDVINAGARPYNQGGTLQSDTLYYNYPQTREDAAASDALISALFFGDDITNIGDPTGLKQVPSQEVMDGEINPRYDHEYVRRTKLEESLCQLRRFSKSKDERA